MTISALTTHVNYVFDENDCPGEIYLDEKAEMQAINEQLASEQLSPAQILNQLVLGKYKWDIARIEFSYLAYDKSKDAVRIWKLINDNAQMLELLEMIRQKQNEVPLTEDEKEHLRETLIDESPACEDFPWEPHWVEIYRRSYKKLDQIITTYTTDPNYVHLDHIFDVSGTALFISNELLMEQTQPISEARIFTNIDEYSGIHDEPEENYIKIPDSITLPNVDGELVTVNLTELQDVNGWSGDLFDYDHEWYDEDAEGEIASLVIRQLEENELHVTDDYYRLRRQYSDILAEFDRLINKDKLVRIANKENKEFSIESAANKISKSRLAKTFARVLRDEFRQGTPPQDIAAFLMIDCPIPLKVNGNITDMIEIFGDDIFDSVVGPAGIIDKPEHVWETPLEEFHNQTIDLLEKVGVPYSVKWTPQFTTAAFQGIAENHLPVGQAFSHAYESFRQAISPEGAHAFRQALDQGASPSKAMQAFYKVARERNQFITRDRIYGASDNYLAVLTASSSFTERRHLSWNLARYKANLGELYVPNSAPKKSKQWLASKLKVKGWSSELLLSLKE